MQTTATKARTTDTALLRTARAAATATRAHTDAAGAWQQADVEATLVARLPEGDERTALLDYAAGATDTAVRATRRALDWHDDATCRALVLGGDVASVQCDHCVRAHRAAAHRAAAAAHRAARAVYLQGGTLVRSLQTSVVALEATRATDAGVLSLELAARAVERGERHTDASDYHAVLADRHDTDAELWEHTDG